MLVLRSGRVLDPVTGHDAVADVVVERGIIQRMGAEVARGLEKTPGVRTLNLAGQWLMPAFVDLGAQFHEPGHEYREDLASGLLAAAAGGYGAVCNSPMTQPVNDTRALTEQLLARSHTLGGPRLYPFAAITRGCEGKELSEMGDLRAAGAVGVSDGGHTIASSAIMRRALEYARTFDLLLVHHCEDPGLGLEGQMHEGAVSTRLGLRGIPRQAEEIILARDLKLVELTGARYHAGKLSSAGSVDLLRRAKAQGLAVSASVAPYHLIATDADLTSYDPNFKLSPPLREASDRRALREGVTEGVIECVASDHQPRSSLEKDGDFAGSDPGAIGLELTLPVLLQLVREGILSPLQVAQRLASGPARVAGLPVHGVSEGAPATLVAVDPSLRWTITPEALRSRSRNTPLLETEVEGAATLTLLDGEIIHQRQ